MGFSRQEYWSGLLCPAPGDLPNPEIKPVSLTSIYIGRWVLCHYCHLERPTVTAPAFMRFPGGSEVKALASNAGDSGLIPGSGRSPGEGNGNPLQYSCLEDPMDGEAWWATIHGVSKSRTWLSDFTFPFPFQHSAFFYSFRKFSQQILNTCYVLSKPWTK